MLGWRRKLAERLLLRSLQLLSKVIALKSAQIYWAVLRKRVADLVFIWLNVTLVVSAQLLTQMVKSPGQSVGQYHWGRSNKYSYLFWKVLADPCQIKPSAFVGRRCE